MLLTKVCILVYDPKFATKEVTLKLDFNKDRMVTLQMKMLKLSNEENEAVLLQSGDLSIDVTDVKSIEATPPKGNSITGGAILLDDDINHDHVKEYLLRDFDLKTSFKPPGCDSYSICSNVFNAGFLGFNVKTSQFRITCYISNIEKQGEDEESSNDID